MSQYIIIQRTDRELCLPVDTTDELEAAEIELMKAGLSEALILNHCGDEIGVLQAPNAEPPLPVVDLETAVLQSLDSVA